jgi:hypothetical protein
MASFIAPGPAAIPVIFPSRSSASCSWSGSGLTAQFAGAPSAPKVERWLGWCLERNPDIWVLAVRMVSV